MAAVRLLRAIWRWITEAPPEPVRTESWTAEELTRGWRFVVPTKPPDMDVLLQADRELEVPPDAATRLD